MSVKYHATIKFNKKLRGGGGGIRLVFKRELKKISEKFKMVRCVF